MLTKPGRRIWNSTGNVFSDGWHLRIECHKTDKRWQGRQRDWESLIHQPFPHAIEAFQRSGPGDLSCAPKKLPYMWNSEYKNPWKCGANVDAASSGFASAQLRPIALAALALTAHPPNNGGSNLMAWLNHEVCWGIIHRHHSSFLSNVANFK